MDAGIRFCRIRLELLIWIFSTVPTQIVTIFADRFGPGPKTVAPLALLATRTGMCIRRRAAKVIAGCCGMIQPSVCDTEICCETLSDCLAAAFDRVVRQGSADVFAECALWHSLLCKIAAPF